MLAITVAVRVDVYGVLYAVSLGILLLVPRSARKVLLVMWVGYLVVHGALLIVQYFFLLGIPSNPTYCLTTNESGENCTVASKVLICQWAMKKEGLRTRETINSPCQ